MGIAEDFQDRTKYIVPAGCKVCDALTKMDKADAYATNDAINNDSVPHTLISKVLRKNGFEISEASVRRHRTNHSYIK